MDPPGQWTVELSNSTDYLGQSHGEVDIAQWFSTEDLREIMAAAQAQGGFRVPLVLEDVTLTAGGEIVPRALALRTSGGDTVLTIVNGSYDQSQYRGTTYAFGYITLSGVQPAAALTANFIMPRRGHDKINAGHLFNPLWPGRSAGAARCRPDGQFYYVRSTA